MLTRPITALVFAIATAAPIIAAWSASLWVGACLSVFVAVSGWILGGRLFALMLLSLAQHLKARHDARSGRPTE